MSETDWEARYQSGDMPWDKGAPSPGLVDFLADRPGLERGRVVVPGCGTGHDVLAWAQAGFTVTGCDIAPSAVQLTRGRIAAAAMANRASVHRMDFLNDPALESHDWLFEHTLFCAIDPAGRDAYVRAVLKWLGPEGNYLAVNYLIPDRDGPPFGVTRDELFDRFTPHFDLIEEKVPRSHPNRTGLELLLWWRRKS